ncbi:MAG: extracellular solute-binding protein [Elusimicrobia bacterium]|nr:extracellular solute-binding protein [Elusimicrobiota bacterium]
MKRILFLVLVGIVSLFLACQPLQHSSSSSSSPEITILWAQWSAADYLQELSRQFTRETGIRVRVVQVHWDHFSESFFGREIPCDLVGGDSQWLGRGVQEGYYTDLTRWIRERAIDQEMQPMAMEGYAEYPRGSGRYWAVPLMGDAMGFAYRKDLFEDPAEQKAFRERYGYELGVPRTWQQLYDVAHFFYRPEKDFYGVNVWATPDYDGTTMGIQTLVWAWGGSLGDPETFQVNGILNVPVSVEALKMYKALHALGHPDWYRAYVNETNSAFMQGKVAMVMSYFAFFPDLVDPAKNPFLGVTGFFANPAGPAGRFSSVGGQGLSLVKWSKNKEAALEFMEWFTRKETQAQWARLGGFPCHREVLTSEEFLAAKPYNPALVESMKILKDFWTVPEYNELLGISRKYWNAYLFDEGVTAEEAMDRVAHEWENIFEAAGYYKE